MSARRQPRPPAAVRSIAFFDGQIYQDSLLEAIVPDSKVYLLPQIAGG